MCSATSSEHVPMTRFLLHGLLFTLLLPSLALSFPQDSSSAVPFKIRRAGDFLQRKDSTGAQIYLLIGDVLISRETTTISCDSLSYFPDSGFFNCLGSVQVADSVRTLRCDTLFYYIERAYYRAAGNMEWNSGKLLGSGDQGEYWRDDDLFRVTGEAFAADSARQLRSETMEYEYATEILRAAGKVRFADNESGSTAEAAGALYRSRDKLLVLRGRPVLTYYEDEDSLHQDPYSLTGDVVTSFSQDSLVAVGRVRLWRDSLSVTSDSLFHDRALDKNHFRGGPPLVEHPEYRLTADLLNVTSRERRLELIEAEGRGRGEFGTGGDSTAPGAQEVLGSWIEGDTLRLFFGSSAMDSIYAAGSARSYYQESGQSGVNYVQGGRLLLVFENNLLEVVEVRGGGRGVYVPPDTGGVITVIPDSSGFMQPADSVSPR
jgi:lipopolysaccharide export system protein LptA